MKRILSALWALGFAGTVLAAPVQPFQNGGFEASTPVCGVGTELAPGSTLMPGWTVIVGSIDWAGSCNWTASEGTWSLDLIGSGNKGGVRQTFDTVPGTYYRVSFDLAGNPGPFFVPPAVKLLSVTVGPTTHNYGFDVTGHTVEAMGWTNQTFTFLASDFSSTIDFVSDMSGVGSSFSGAAIDNVQITALAETPPSVPFIDSVVAGDASITVYFSPPVSDGGSPITGYTAVCGVQGTGGISSPLTVGALVNGTPYTCTVSATNAVGTGAESSPSNSVTPMGAGGGIGTAWTGSSGGVSNLGIPIGSLPSVISDGTAGTNAVFTYATVNDYCCHVGDWTFETIATTTGPVTLNWSYSGYHGTCYAVATLTPYAKNNGGTTFGAPVYNEADSCSGQLPSGGFGAEGQITLQVDAGYAYGFTMHASNGDFNGGVEGRLTVTTGTSPTTTVVGVSANPVVYGASSKLTATVNGSFPTGTVTFTQEGRIIYGCDAVPMITGSASCWTVLPPGQPNIVALYTGDAVNAGSQSTTLLVTVNTGTPTASFVVNDLADTVDAGLNGTCADSSGHCTLRAAVMEASAYPGAATITVPAGTYALSIGGLTLSGNVTINGAGAANTIVEGDGSGRVFTVSSGMATLSGLTVRDGDGGISNSGSLTLREASVSDNIGSGDGGGILNLAGQLVLDRSTVSRNEGGGGAGIYSYNGTLTLTNSTVSENVSTNTSQCGFGGGGLWIYAGQATITNSTLFENYAECSPGAGGRGHAIATTGGPEVTVRNSILASPSYGAQMCYGPVTSLGYNLFGDNSCSDVATDLIFANPQLHPLDYYSGPTPTHELLLGSPARDAVPFANCATALDQGGTATALQDGNGFYFRRPQGAACDIGSVESANAPPAPAVSLASNINPIATGGTVTLTATVTGINPTGTVAFADLGGPICAAANLIETGDGLTAAATCNASGLSIGVHQISAVYSGDASNSSASSPTLSQVINQLWVIGGVTGSTSFHTIQEDGTTGVAPLLEYGTSSGPSSGTWRFQTIASRTGTIRVDYWDFGFAGITGATAGLSAFVNGNVTPLFNAGPVNCDPCTAPSASFSYYGYFDFAVTAGDTYGFIATAANADQYNIEALLEVSEVSLAAGPSTLTLSSSATPIAAGDPVTFTAHVASQNSTGSVTFFSDGVAIRNLPGDSLGDCVLVATNENSDATCTVSNLTAGTHTITARYAGTIYSPEAISNSVTQEIAGGGSASFTVDTTADAVDANPGDGICADSLGRCTLRAAIMEANALPGPQTIYLGDGVYNVFPGSPGAFSISDDLVIVGIGAPFTIVSGNNVDRVFNITAGTVTLSQLAVQAGLQHAGQAGGGIMNQGNLQLDRVEVRDNVTVSDGAGIFNTGTLAIDRSTIADNVGGAGAGIYSVNAWLSMTNSTVSGNHSIGVSQCALGGGGMFIDGGNTYITSSTIFNNVAECPGFGGRGDAIAMRNAPAITILNSIITGPTQNYGAACYAGVVTSQGHNILGDSSCGPVASDIVTTNPLLGSLGYNGGLTRTHLPWVGSPARDAFAAPCDLAGDQSGVVRPQGSGCDIGSFEAGPPTAPYTPSTPTASAAGNGQLSVAFGPPGTDGGSPITGYTATCALSGGSGAQSASGAASPITVSGLTNGSFYSCTVTATNAIGTGPASFQSNFVAPSASAAPTTTGLTSSTNPGTAGVAVTFLATVNDGGANPGGTVDFADQFGPLSGCSAVAVVAQQAQCLQSFPVGTRQIVASYSGTATLAPSTSNTVSQVINAAAAASSTAVTALITDSAYGQPVAFTATITGQTPTGTVHFKDGGTTIAGCVSSTVAGGAAQCTINTLRVGVHSITAEYSGDASNTASVSPSYVHAVTAGAGTVTPMVDTGDAHSCSLSSSGRVQCWGDNSYGELGDGTTNSRQTPFDVTGLTSGVTAIGSGLFQVCAVTDVGGLKCWGRNNFGQIGDGSTTNRLVPVEPVGLSSDVLAVAGGYFHTCALLDDGTVRCWGYNTFGQLGDGTQNDSHAPVTVTGLTNVVAISAGNYFNCALTASGGVKCWGANAQGYLGDGTQIDRTSPVDVVGLTSGVAAIAAGGDEMCALSTAGALKCWGYNGSGAVGDGTLVANRLTPVDVAGLSSNVTAIGGGSSHACAVMADGALKCWGGNFAAQLGDGSNANRVSPVDVTGLSSGIVAVAPATYHTCALAMGGGVKCWGQNNLGQLGANTGAYQLTPIDVTGLNLASTVPGAPTGVTATAGNGQASVSFSAPASDGGSAITGYTATCGSQSASGAGSPITVSGLTNGTSYTCTVIATNSAGNSLASSASNAVTPTPGSVSVGVSSLARAVTSPTMADSVAYTLTFAAPVSGVSASNLAIAATGITAASIANVTGSGTTWTVDVNTGRGTGTLRLDLANVTGVVDGSGTPLAPTTFSGETYDIDKGGTVAVGGPGQPDATFGTNGYALFSNLEIPSAPGPVAVLANGRILVAGTIACSESSNFCPLQLARYLATGMPDTSFGTGGFIATSITDANPDLNPLIVNADGSFFVSGMRLNGVDTVPFVAKFAADGSPATYGVAGVASLNSLPTGFGQSDAAIDSLGRIVVVGTVPSAVSLPDRDEDIFVTRLLPTGLTDSTFGTSGVAKFAISSAVALDRNDRGTTLAIQPDDKIVVGGRTVNSPPHNFDFLLMRVGTTGALDLTFGTAGIATTHFPASTGTNLGRKLVLQPDGKIVLVGGIEVGSGFQCGVARFNGNGTLDAAFGTAGMVRIPVNGSCFNVALQPDGKLVVGSDNADGDVHYATLLRILSDGGPDPAFGSGGILEISSLDGAPTRVAVTASGNLVTGFAIEDPTDGVRKSYVVQIASQLATPTAPTNVTATAGNGQAVVTFTPTIIGGASPNSSYTATCGSQSASGPGSPITVSGLTNGASYTCTVTATNVVGTGAPSSSSNSITPLATITATNLLQVVASAGSALVIGRVDGAQPASVTFQAYSGTSCTGGVLGNSIAAGPAITVPTTTDNYFGARVDNIASGKYVAIQVTSPSTTPVSTCLVNSGDNAFWTTALELLWEVDGTASGGDFIDVPGKARWYKFSVSPGQRITVTLSNLPADYDLTVYKDIEAAFLAQVTPADTADPTTALTKLSAEFAPSAFSPSAFSPSAFSPSAFSPSAFSPSAFSPSAFSANVYSPSAFSPSAFSPSAFSPSAFSPSAFSPSAFSPSAFSPSAFSPSAFSPSAFSDDVVETAFSSAQTKSIVGVSATPGTGDESVVVDTWNNTGYFYARVAGRGDASSTSNEFTISVTKIGATCDNVSALEAFARPAAGGPEIKTIILTDLSKIPLGAKLTEFASRSEIGGVVIDVNADSRVHTLNQQAAGKTSCPFATNLVAEEIKSIVDSYRANSSLKYVVIAGGDDVIPFFRYPDESLIGQESGYVPPVTGASDASLRGDYVLGQDAYGALTRISMRTSEFPIPGLAVGRLVKTPFEISGMIDAYVAAASAPGGAVRPTSSLVTGYDFLADVAYAITDELQQGTNVLPDQLIEPNGNRPAVSWTASALGAKLFGSRHDVIFLAGHFNASSALAADFTTNLITTDLATSTTDFTNSIVFSAGCHTGYSIVSSDALTGVTFTLDWAQAFAQKKATLVAGTGYQYGDTDFIEYSERLYLNFARELRAGNGVVPIGEALVKAKLDYLIATPDIRGIHQKAVLEATLYGLPMLGVEMPSGRGGASAIASAGTNSNASRRRALSTNASPLSGPGGSGSVTFDPAPPVGSPAERLALATATLALGTSRGPVASPITLTPHHLQLKDAAGFDGPDAKWFSGLDNVVSHPAEPVLPLEVVDVTPPPASGVVLRGVGFRGGSYLDTELVPLTGAPATEIRGVHVPFASPYFFPMRPWTINYFGLLAGYGSTGLLVTPVQHRAANLATGTSIQRAFTGMSLRLFYSGNFTDVSLSAAPTIGAVSAQPAGVGSATFTAQVTGDPAATIQQVWITYTNGGGTWDSIDLEQCVALSAACTTVDSQLWKRTAAISGSSIQYVVQAASGIGLVSLDDNRGAYYSFTGVQPFATALTLGGDTAGAVYGASANISATLSGGTPLSGKTIVFEVGGASSTATTNSGGVAAVTVPVNTLPGNYQVKGSFAGDGNALASSASTPAGLFVVTRAPSSLSAFAAGYATILAASVGGQSRPLLQESVKFTLTLGGTTKDVYANTDLNGVASLPPADVPPGTYNVTASFAGNSTFLPTTQGQSVPISILQQTIAVDAGGGSSLPNSLDLSGTAAFAATTNAGQPVLFTVAAPSNSVCSLAKTGATSYTVTALTAGTCTLLGTANPTPTYGGATFTKNIVVKGAQTITFSAPAVSGTSAAYNSTLQATATSSSLLPVSIGATGSCSIVAATGTVTMTSATGLCTLTASQPGNASFSAAADVVRTINATPAAQTITFSAPAASGTSATYNSTVQATASSSSLLPVSIGATGSCSIVAATGVVTMTSGTGVCTLTASQAGSVNYSAATDVVRTINATPAAQTITFPAPPASAAYNSTFVVTATSTSSLAVTIAASGSCSIVAATGVVTMTSSSGTCTLTASQAGSVNYSAAADVVRTVAPTGAGQTIAFTAPPASAAYNATFVATATSTSGLPVTIGASGSCSIVAATGVVTMTSGTGICTLTASQAGNATYAAAPNVVRTVNATLASQIIAPLTVTPSSPVFVLNGTFAVSTTSGSGLPLTYQSLTTSSCTVSGTPVSSGTSTPVTMKLATLCTIQATQSGDSNYLAASPVAKSLTIGKAAQTIDFPAIGDKSLGLPPFAISAKAMSGAVPTQLVVSFAATDTAICTVSAGTLAPSGTTSATLTLKSTGTCTITASRADDGPTGNYNAATPVAQSFQINAANIWTPTAGKMTVPRSHHTATRFESGPLAGKVLIAGGMDANGKALDTTELYDPVTRKFTASGKLNGKSVDHTATLLQDGRVVVIGGGDDKVDVFTPATQKWTSFGAPPSNRASHTATLLPDGRVLVVGGVNGPDKSYNTTVIFNPTTGKFTNGPTMDTGRERHTATLITSGPNAGKVLIVGGRDATGKGPTVTLGTWQLCSATACTPSQGGIAARAKHDAVAFTTASGAAKVLIAGGTDGTNNLASAEIYDVATGVWSNTGLGVLTPARKALRLTELSSGRVLASGGRGKTTPSATGAPLAAADVYSPPFATAAPMGVGRSWHTATPLKDAAGNITGVLVVGGKSGNAASSDEDDSGNPSVDTAEVYGTP